MFNGTDTLRRRWFGTPPQTPARPTPPPSPAGQVRVRPQSWVTVGEQGPELRDPSKSLAENLATPAPARRMAWPRVSLIKDVDVQWLAAGCLTTQLTRGYPPAIALSDLFAEAGVKLPIFGWPVTS